MSIPPRLAGQIRLALAFAVLGVFLCTVRVQAQDRQAAPEAATGWMGRTLATAKSQMVSAANPYAVEAGLEMLRAGGSAADAAIAVQLVLNLVEPQSSGIGGGAFILHWNAERKELKTYDGRETAPMAAKPDRFLVEGEPRGMEDAIYGGLSIGVPGTLRALDLLHKQQGKLPWARLFAPAIKLAADGFRVPSRLHLLLRWYGADSFSPAARRYFFDQTGSARPIRLSAAGTRSSRRRCARSPSAGPMRSIRGRSPRRSCGRCKRRPIMPATSRWPISPATAPRSASRCAPPIATIASAAWARPRPGGIAVAQTLKLLEPFDLGTSPTERHERQGAAPDRRGAEARLRRPRPLHRRSGLRAGAGRPAGEPLSRYAPRLDRPGRRHAASLARQAAGDRQPHAGRRRDRRAAGHQPFLHRRCRRQRAVDDHHHRVGVRLAACGRPASCSTTS